MYGSTETKIDRTRICPSPAFGIGDSTSLKSESFGKPTGLAASTICLFVIEPLSLLSMLLSQSVSIVFRFERERSLSCGFIKQDRRGGGDVERFHSFGHRYVYQLIGFTRRG